MADQRTPYRHYFIPILTTLVNHNGTARIEDVYRDVERSVQFNDYDRTYIDGSVPELVWRNQTREAAYKLRKLGLLERSGRYGVWQISDAGRRYLEQPCAEGAGT